MDDLYERLAEVGLDGAAGRIYVHLHTTGGAKAGEIARDLSLGRGETYRILKDLVDREIVTSTLDRPIRFLAIPPERLFEGLLGRARERLSTIERTRDEITDVLARLESQAETAQGGRSFRMIHGRPAAAAAWERLVRSARSSVLVVSVDPTGWRMVDAFGGSGLVAGAADSGARVMVLTSPGPEGKDPRDPRVDCRIVEAHTSVNGLVVDDREVLVWAMIDPSRRLNAEGDIVLWSDSPDFVRAQAALFSALARTGKLHEP